jgi:TolB-like protein
VDEPVEVFALANEGLIVPRKEEIIGKLKEGKKKSHLSKYIIAAVTILILVASYFVYQHYYYATGFSGEKTIAVLPFENIGVPDSEEYVSDGITQDIIGSLSNISSLKRVIGWFSVKQFKKTTKPLEEIANELGVAAILSGSLQVKGEKTRIIVELVEVGTKKRLWGDDFEFYSKDILNAQSKVPEEIVNALKASVTPEEKRELTKQYAENPEAYRLYRKGLYFWNKNNQPGFDSAEKYYNNAIEIDPDYAAAFSGLANCYILSRKLSQLESIPIAKMYAEHALSLDSTLSEAWATLGLIQSYFDYDWVKSKTTLEKAIQLNSNNADAHLFYGNLLQYTSESAELGIKEVKRALELDPLNTRYNWVLARNYYFDRQYDLAYKQVSKTLILDPNYAMAKETLVFLYVEKKMYPQAFKVISQMPNIPVSNLSYQELFLCYYFAASGDSSHAKSQLQTALVNAKFPHNLFFAYTYIALKNYSEALTFLEKAYEKREILLYWVKVDPILDPIRNEPRFKILMKKMHLG